MSGLLYICLMFSERRSGVNITDEKFVEVLKSLTQEDFDAAKVLVDQIGSKFNNRETRNLFTEDEIENLSKLLDSYGNDVRVVALVGKFKESLCSQ